MAAVLHLLDQRRLIDSNGISDGGEVAFYYTDTLTPATIYADVGLTTPLENPVVVGAGAEVPQIYLDGAITYRRVITYSDGSTDETDPYTLPDYLVSAASYAAAAAASEVAAESARDEVLAYGNTPPYVTWTALAAAVGMSAGDLALVLASDSGTHTDPVVGGTVNNAGVYRYDDSPAGWERVGDLESQLTEADADRAESEADAAAVSAAAADAVFDNVRLTNAIALMGQAATADANGFTIPNRDGAIGTMIDLSFATPEYVFGAYATPVSMIDFARSGSAGAIGGASSDTFVANEMRVHDGKLFLDVGGTNPVVGYADISNAQWTKSGLNAAGITSVAGEESATSAKRIPETNTGVAATHVLQNNVTVSSNSNFFVGAIVDAERGYLQMDLYNSGTTAGVRARFDLTGTGSVISPYPAGLGSGTTNPAAGVVALGGGLFFVYIACTLPSATTTARVYFYHMSTSTTTSYVGDTSKALIVEKVWMTPGSRTPVSYIDTTRAAETLTIPLLRGAYIEQSSDGTNSLLAPLLLATSSYRALTFPSWVPWLTRYRLYGADAYDAMDRSDTSDGDIGTASDGGEYSLYNAYVASYPLPTATTGKITSNWVTVAPASGSTGTIYAVRDIGKTVRYASATVRFGAAVAGGGTLTNTSFALLFSTDESQLVNNMPVHMVLTRSALQVQKRLAGGSFVTVGQIGSRILPDSSEHTVSVALHGSLAVVTLDSQSVVISDADFATACEVVCWEINTSSDNTTDKAQFKNSVASTALVGDTPTYAAAAPVVTLAAATTPSAPATYTSGCTLSVSASPAAVSSNTGAVTITAYQWYRNGVLIGGATGATHLTTAGTDTGATFYCAITYTNSTGPTVGNSVTTSALA